MGELEPDRVDRAGAGARGGRLLRGPGDDAAVVRADGAVAVTSVDAMVEGVHFKLATHSPADIGHKALAAALSDLAAMGARPGEAYVALGLPAGLRRGGRAGARARRWRRWPIAPGIAIAGGDVVSAPQLLAVRDRDRLGRRRGRAGLPRRRAARRHRSA